MDNNKENALASQSQAAQPTIKTWVERLPEASVDIMRDVADAKDAEIAELRAHIAGTSQAAPIADAAQWKRFADFSAKEGLHGEAYDNAREAFELGMSVAGTSQATKAQADDELATKLNEAVAAEYPMPDSPHASVIQRTVDNRAAMWRGINAARKILAPVAKEAPAVLSAWMRSNRKECTTAESKAWMESAGFGHWPSIAAEYTIPLYEGASVAKEATRDQDEQQADTKRIDFQRCLIPFHGGLIGQMGPLDQIQSAESEALFARRFRAQGGMTNTESGSDIATTTSTVSAPDDRDTLAFAIARAAERRGIINANTPLTGPQLVMLCDALAAPSSTEGAQKAPEEVRYATYYRHIRNLTVEQAGAPGQPSIALPNGMNSGYYITEETADHAIEESIKERALRTSSTDQANADTGSAE